MGNCTSLKTGAEVLGYVWDTNATCDKYTLPTTGTHWSIPSGAAATAANATTISLGTMPAGLLVANLPAGATVGFVLANGTIIPATLTAPFTQASTSLSVKAIGAAIPAATPFYYPIPIGQITNVTTNDNINIITGESTDANNFATAGAGIKSGTIEIAFEANDTDPGILTLEYFRSSTPTQTCGITIYDPQYKTFIKRKLTREVGFVGTMSTSRPRNGQITGSVTFTAVFQPDVVSNEAA